MLGVGELVDTSLMEELETPILCEAAHNGVHNLVCEVRASWVLVSLCGRVLFCCGLHRLAKLGSMRNNYGCRSCDRKAKDCWSFIPLEVAG